MKQHFFFLCISACFSFFWTIAQAQQPDPPCRVHDCQCLEDKAAKALSATPPDFQTAIEKYQALALCDPARRAYADQQILTVFKKIQALQTEAIQNAAKAKTNEKKAVKAKKVADAVLDKIYFYADEFGLAYNQLTGQYGYIDKDLNTKIEYKYDEAFSFEEPGYAWVKRKVEIQEKDSSKYVDTYFLIDTLGKEYKLAYEIHQLDSSITALDLRTASLDSMPDEVYKNKQLEILFIPKNLFDIGKLPQLSNLKTLFVNEFSGIKLYFDADQPIGQNALSTTTALNYQQSFVEFMRRKAEYKERLTTGLDSIAKHRTVDLIEDFFERDVRGGWNQFFSLTDQIDVLLEKGYTVVVTIKGAVSPFNRTLNGRNVAARRLDSIKNHFFSFDGGILKKYIISGQLVIKLDLEGENFTQQNNDDRTGIRHSIYDPEVMRERRVELIDVEIKKGRKE